MNTGLSTALIRQDFFSFFQRAFMKPVGDNLLSPHGTFTYCVIN